MSRKAKQTQERTTWTVKAVGKDDIPEGSFNGVNCKIRASQYVNHIFHSLPALARMIIPVLYEMRDEGRIYDLAMVDPQLWTLTPAPARELPKDHIPGEPYSGWQEVARYCSTKLGGQWRYTPNGVTWNHGGEALWITNPSMVESIYSARACVHHLTGVSKLPFGVGALARKMLDWCGIVEKNWRSGDELRKDVKHYYQFCTPCTRPKASYWDVKSCFSSILDRMPSPLLTLVPPSRIVFLPLSPFHKGRWEAVKDAAREHKLLRNCLVGSMTGGSKQGWYWYRGNKKPSPKVRGPLRPAGLLVARTAYELLAEVVERANGAALYANVDSCILDEGGDPLHTFNPYTRYDLEIRKLAEGETEVCGIGVYRCGSKRTKLYQPSGAMFASPQLPSITTTISGPVWSRWLDNVRIKK